MSLSDITKSNNYTLYAGELNVDAMNVESIVVDNATVNNDLFATNLTSPNGSITDLSSSTISSSSISSTNASVAGILTVPNIKTNSFSTISGAGTILSGNGISAPTMTATTSLRTPSIGNGFLDVTFTNGISLPNTVTTGNILKYYLQTTGTVNTSGAVVTTLNYRATRIGGMVNICVQTMDTTTLATGATFLTISGFPSDFLPNSTSTNGPILTNTSTGITLGRYQFNGSGNLVIFASLAANNFVIGQPCGLFGGLSQFATFTFSRTP